MACIDRRIRVCRTSEGNFSSGLVWWTPCPYLGEPSDSGNHVSALVHDDDGASSKTRLSVLERVEIHAATRG